MLVHDYPLRILRLTVHNFARISVVDITPQADASTVRISGLNESGKTSLLNSIAAAIEGIKLTGRSLSVNGARIPEPIRHGADEARIKADIGTSAGERLYTVERTISHDKKPQLTIKNNKGKKFGVGQDFLDDLAPHLGYDVGTFITKMNPKEQFEELIRISGIDRASFDKIDEENRKDFERRTFENRMAKERKAQAEAIEVDEGIAYLPKDRLNVAALIDEMKAAGDRNAAIERDAANRKANVDRAKGLRDRASELRKQAANLEMEAYNIEESLKSLRPLGNLLDTFDLRERIANAEVINGNIQRYEQRAAIEREAEEAAKESKRLTEAMEARTTKKQDMLAKCDLPVKGLGLSDGKVTVDGVPFEQLSDGAQWRTACAIAMSRPVQLQVVLIRRGSLIDERNLKVIDEMAAAKGWQVWVETVGEGVGGDGSVILEDGAVKDRQNGNVSPVPAVAIATKKSDDLWS